MVYESIYRLLKLRIFLQSGYLSGRDGLIVNGVCMFILGHDEYHHGHDHHGHDHHGHDHHGHDHHGHDHNLRAAYLHVLADTLNLFSHYCFGLNSMHEWLDRL